MLVDEGFEGRHEAGRLEADEGPEKSDLGLPDPIEPGVPGDPAEGAVEGEVGVDEGDPVADSGRPPHLVEGSFELAPIRRVAAADDETGRRALEGGTDLVDLFDLSRIEGRDKRAAAGILPDEPFGPQHGECFADRASARLELTGDVGLHEAKAGWKGSRQDPLAEKFRRGLGEGGASEDWQLELVHRTVGC